MSLYEPCQEQDYANIIQALMIRLDHQFLLSGQPPEYKQSYVHLGVMLWVARLSIGYAALGTLETTSLCIVS